MLNGALWSTMMMVFAPDTLWRQIQRISPELCDPFRIIYEAIGTIAEKTVVQETYNRLPSVNFSKGLLEPLAQNQLADFRVLPVRDVVWSDWGSEVRVMEVLRKTGYASRLNGLRSPQQVTIKSAQTPLSEELPKQHVEIGPLRNTVTL
jgi:mannose-1-phosphate guanylyltransferase